MSSKIRILMVVHAEKGFKYLVQTKVFYKYEAYALHKCKASQLDNLSMYYRIKGKHWKNPIMGFASLKKCLSLRGEGVY